MSNLYAAHHIVSDDNSIANGVVEIEDGVVKRAFHLEKRDCVYYLAWRNNHYQENSCWLAGF